MLEYTLDIFDLLHEIQWSTVGKTIAVPRNPLNWYMKHLLV